MAGTGVRRDLDPGIDVMARSEVRMTVEFDGHASSSEAVEAGRWQADYCRTRSTTAPSGCGVLEVTPRRLVVRWARQAHDGFVPYDDLWPVCASDLDCFRRFVRSQGGPDLGVAQCELTYVNPLSPGTQWHSRGLLRRLLVQRAGVDPLDTLLPAPEDVQSGTRYKIHGSDGVTVGRLYVLVRSMWIENPEPMVLVTLSAQGRPGGGGMEGVKAFFDVGFEWIVRGFAALTTGAPLSG
jgi:hypothetical protein